MENLNLIYDPADYSWRTRARCRNVDTNEFFPEDGENASHLKEFCGGCDVRAECLAFALKHNITDGVFGGTSPRERREIRMGRKEFPHAAVRD